MFQYGCIRVLAFVKCFSASRHYSSDKTETLSHRRLTVSKNDAYASLMKLKDERPDALFLDLGCCFGNDVRKVVSDGWPVGQCVASDLRPGNIQASSVILDPKTS